MKKMLWSFFSVLVGTCYQGEMREVMGAEVMKSATEAWKEVEKGHGTLRPPVSWREKKPTEEEVEAFRIELKDAARRFAEAARKFLEQFPDDENAGDARFTVVYALGHAVAAGDAAAEKEAEQFLESGIADPKIAPEEKAKLLMMSANVPFMKKVGMRYFVEGQQKFSDEMDRAMVDSLKAARKRFPNSEFVYTGLLAVADRSEPAMQKELVKELLDASETPADVRFFAEHLAKGTKPYQIGKPVEIRFTGLDGEEIDVAKMKGKVVLVDFWSTTCGPCIGQIPELKALDAKYGDKGLQIVGINLDEKESAVRRFLKEKELKWPQHFAGKGWANPIATRYGIFGIPTNWLIDRKGNLRETQARGDLDRVVGQLLAEGK
jgi:thiol-disulfide isomerase/thioredoxin